MSLSSCIPPPFPGTAEATALPGAFLVQLRQEQTGERGKEGGGLEQGGGKAERNEAGRTLSSPWEQTTDMVDATYRPETPAEPVDWQAVVGMADTAGELQALWG